MFFFVSLELKNAADKNTVMTILTHKLVKLGRMYGGSEKYFPIGKKTGTLSQKTNFKVFAHK